MAIYIITYDLNTPGKDYSKLYKALDLIGAIRIQDSVFMVKSDLPTLRIKELLVSNIDKTDSLFIAPIIKNAGGQMLPEFWNWFNAL